MLAILSGLQFPLPVRWQQFGPDDWRRFMVDKIFNLAYDGANERGRGIHQLLGHITRMETIEYIVTEFRGPDGRCRGTVADLMLDAHMIPRCGLIPPFRVVAAVFRSGGGDGGMSAGCIWRPFALSEEEYWEAIRRLEQFTPEELRSRHRDPHIVGEIQQDYSATDTDDYSVWMDSLGKRGLL